MANNDDNNLPQTEEAAPNTDESSSNKSGPKSLHIRAHAGSYGFTLRHFIVYPPDPDDDTLDKNGPAYALSQMVYEPMDTIFVKNVVEGGPAHQAGLVPGDRIVSVNGETIGGKSYAQVVRVIQNSGSQLRLLVAPKEDDILQLYFSEAAHHPQTNRRPAHLNALYEAAMSNHKGQQFSHLPRPIPYRSPAFPPYSPSSSATGSSLSVSTVLPLSTVSGSAESVPSPSHTWQPVTRRPASGGRRSSEQYVQPERTRALPKQHSLPSANCADAVSSVPKFNSFESLRSDPLQLQQGTPRYRFSVDGGAYGNGYDNRRDSTSSLPVAVNAHLYKDGGTDSKSLPPLVEGNLSDADSELADSVLRRIRKSFEQKEEFLRRPIQPTWLPTAQTSPPVPREFYAQPQKFQRNPWPPAQVQAAKPKQDARNQQRARSDLKDNQSEDSVNGRVPRPAKPFVSKLTRIQENIPSSEESSPSKYPGNFSYDSSSPGDERVPAVQIVSKRAKQFESGELDSETSAKTNLYRSELSRLTSPKTVPNVAARKQEYEMKSKELQPLNSTGSSTRPQLSGNRTTVVGSGKLHCEPPIDYIDNDVVESGLLYGPSAVTDGLAKIDNGTDHEMTISSPSPRPIRPNLLPLANPHRPASVEDDDVKMIDDDDDDDEEEAVNNHHHTAFGCAHTANLPEATVTTTDGATLSSVVRRKKAFFEDDSDRIVRRVSYLKATSGDRHHVDSDLELSDVEAVNSNQVERPSQSIQKLRTLFGEKDRDLSGDKENVPINVVSALGDQVRREGWLHCKLTLIDGKRAPDRSWKQFWAVLRGPVLFLCKDKKDASQSPQSLEEHTIELRNSSVDVAGDYTKKKHVFRLSSSSGTEYLFQSEDEANMLLWVKALHENSAVDKEDVLADGKRLLVKGHTSRLSPNPGNKTIRKLTPFRNRSPTGHSPVTKTRKQSQTGEQLPSPKSKTWKGRVAKQFRKIQGSTPNSPTTPQAEGCTIGILLEDCVPSTFSEYVPLLVELCTSIVESKGVEVIGIYRVPGNTAAVSALTEAVNKGFDGVNLQDPRWNDVNVISSLLKSFFRKLPEPMLTSELYPRFILADKIEDGVTRMRTLKKLINELPEHHYETLKYLLKHLQKIVNHSYVNKMEARNLAIVFGPTLVRPANDSMVTMVTDMPNQCHIVETLLIHVDWFYSDDEGDDLLDQNVPVDIPLDTNESDAPVSNPNLLLNNIQKVEGMKFDSPTKELSAKDIVSSIISAANRKMQKGKHKKEETKSAKTKESKEVSSKHADRSRSSENNNASTTNMEPPMPNDYVTSHVLTLVRPHLEALPEGRLQTVHAVPVRTWVPGDTKGQVQGRPDVTERLGDDVAVRTYAELNAMTREWTRKFEMETKANLRRDVRQRREMERRELEKRRLELELEKAKRDMENEDYYDYLADHPSDVLRQPHEYALRTTYRQPVSKPPSHFVPPHQPASTKHPSISRHIPPSSPHSLRRGNSVESLFQRSNDADATNSNLKRFKTTKQGDAQHSQSGLNFGSLDSLRDYLHVDSNEAGSSESSDNASDFLASITKTFDTKLKLLRDPNYKLAEESPAEIAEENKTSEKCPDAPKDEQSEKDPNRTDDVPAEKKPKNLDALSKTEKTVCNIKTKQDNRTKEDATSRRKTRRGRTLDRSLKRRHTVGGTKDMDKIHWLYQRSLVKKSKLSAWEQLQPLISDNNLNSDRSLQTWLRRERLRSSSPDLSQDETYVVGVGCLSLPGRRHSLHEASLPAYVCAVPLESQV